MTAAVPLGSVPWYEKYRKAVLVVAVTVALAVSTLATDGITLVEWVMISGVGVSAVGTAVVPNLDEGIARHAKTLVTFLLTGLTVAFSAAAIDGIDVQEWVEIVVAALAAVGVTAVPNVWPPATLTWRAEVGSRLDKYEVDPDVL